MVSYEIKRRLTETMAHYRICRFHSNIQQNNCTHSKCKYTADEMLVNAFM